MATIIAVHQCLFCPQTFVTAAEKDDHVLEHFAQETCTECDQKLIRIGGNLYTRHNAVTCIKIDVKIENFTEASSPVNHSGYITEIEDDITASGSDNDDWSTTFSMIKESICVDERVITESIDECEQANVVLKNEDSDDFLLAPQMNNDNEIEIDPMPMNEVVDDIIEDSLECTQLDSENKPKSDPQLINSIKTNDEKRKIGCNICGKILLATSLVLHKKTQHAPPGTYICRICHKEFPNEQELSKHQAGCLCKTRKKVRCNDCGKMFNKTTIARHKRAYHSPEGTPVCKRCCKIFSNEEELSLHQSVCLLKRKPIEKGHFECDICKKVYPSKKCLKQHMNWMHNPKYNKKPKILPCNICGKVLRKRGMSKHMASFHSDGSTYFCEICTKIFRNEAELLSHKTKCVHDHRQTVEPFNSQQKREIHNDLAGTSATQSQIEHEEEPYTQIKDDIQLKEEIVDDGTNLISFEDSNQQLESESQSHELMRTKPVKRNDIVCDFCGKLFKSQFILQQHQIRFHSAPNVHSCSCGQIFKTSEQLETHRLDCAYKKKETKISFKILDKTLECYLCHKVFKGWQNLTNHARGQHIFGKTFKCSLCERRCLGRSALQVHYDAVHLNIRKFVCSICGKSFKFSQSFRHHQFTHKAEKNIKCKFEGCGKYFVSPKGRSWHMRIHSGRKYICPTEGCSKEFSSSSGVYRHRRKVHGLVYKRDG